MAQTSLAAAVLLLALIANHIDCSTSMLWQNEYDCNKATYEKSNLKDFVKQCTPGSWEDFFTNEKVEQAIKVADEIRQQPLKEMIVALKKKNKNNEVIKYHIEPSMQRMFEAFKSVGPKDVKVVILGQDPTPQVGKATGKAFSVEDPRTVGTVMNVLLEVAYEGWSVDLDNGDLSKWEAQGVLLLNSALTIGQITYINEKKEMKTKQVPHLNYWHQFTQLLIQYISDSLLKPPVWMLWGNTAQGHGSSIKNGYILTGGHPSSLGSVGVKNTFFAGSYFLCATQFLYETRKELIYWGLRDGDNKRHEVNNKLAQCPNNYIHKNKIQTWY